MKYRPDYPDGFGGAADAWGWAEAFFNWYNHNHHHTGLGLLTPASMHMGRTEVALVKRQQTLQEAYVAHPERFVKWQPTPAMLPQAV
jgi:putative transposase